MKLARRGNLSLVTLLFIVPAILAACDGDPTSTPSATAAAPTSTTSRTAAPALLTAGATLPITPTGNLIAMRIGYIPSMNSAPLFLAIDRGYFAQEGIDAQLTTVQAGSDAIVQLAAGNFEVAVGGVGASQLNAVSRGVKFKIVAPMQHEYTPATSPLVISSKRRDEIKSVADLKGKKVAVNSTGSVGDYFMSQALKTGGLTLDDVQLTAVTLASMPAALASGSIDAAILSEPYFTQNLSSGTISVLADDFDNGFTSSYLYMGESFLNDKPQLAKGFIRAVLRACRDLQGDYLKNDPSIAGLIEKYTHVPADVVVQARAPHYGTDGVVPIQDLKTLQDFFLQRGDLEYKQPIDVTTFVDDSIARQVASELR